MRVQGSKSRLVGITAFCGFFVLAGATLPPSAFTLEELTRKVKDKFPPNLARRMNIHGMVKLAVVVCGSSGLGAEAGS